MPPLELCPSPLERKHFGVWKTGPEMIPLSHDPSSIYDDGADHRIGTRRSATFRRQAQGRHHVTKILRVVYPHHQGVATQGGAFLRGAQTAKRETSYRDVPQWRRRFRIRRDPLSPDADDHRFLRDLEERLRTVRADAAAFAPFLAFGFGQRRMRCSQPSDRDAVRRAADVIESELMAEFHRTRVASMFTADAELDAGPGFLSACNGLPHQRTDPFPIEHGERDRSP